MLVKIVDDQVDEYPYSVEKFRADNSTVSFPAEISSNTLAMHGVFSVGYQPVPDYDPTTHKVVVSSQPSLVEGLWVLTKTVVAMTENEVADYEDKKAAEARRTRNDKLSETDWCALSDVTMSAEMTTYRQALRDVPQQAGFPHNITWPTKP